MKQCKSFMIRCFIEKGTEHHVQDLFDRLKREVQKLLPKASCLLYSGENYWKYPEDKDVIFQMKSDEPLRVIDFLNHIPLHWEYLSSVGHNAGSTERYLDEEGLWSKIECPQDEFFLPEVRWVHIYTWSEDKVEK